MTAAATVKPNVPRRPGSCSSWMAHVASGSEPSGASLLVQACGRAAGQPAGAGGRRVAGGGRWRAHELAAVVQQNAAYIAAPLVGGEAQRLLLAGDLEEVALP